MASKMINVDKEKWSAFRKWCVTNDTTITKQLDKFLNKFIKED